MFPRREVWKALLSMLAVVVCSTIASAQTQEWMIVESQLEARTTAALHRYFTIAHPDSIYSRYIARNTGVLPYRVRGRRESNDTSWQILRVSLGQLSLITPEAIRIALGDDLYEAVLLSRYDPRSGVQTVIGSGFDLEDWQDDVQWVIAPLQRLEYRFDPTIGIFAGIGAPESNLYWWTDASARIGLSSPEWEASLLVPFSGGALAVGPYRARLLSPGWGAALTGRLGSVVARARFTEIVDASFDATRTIDEVFVHTLSSQLYYRGTFNTTFGSFHYNLGVGYEEFTKGYRDTIGIRDLGRIRRISPILDLVWATTNQNMQLSLGMADLGVRGSVSAQLTDLFWLNIRFVSNSFINSLIPSLRPVERFEHPFYLYISPAIRF